jgi:molybdate transport system substrate-binding protein
MKLSFPLFTSLGMALLLATNARSQGAQIVVLSSVGIKAVLEEIGPEFEQATNHKLGFQFATAAELKMQIEKGEAFDVAILTAAAIDDLIKQAKLAVATRADVAKSGVGVAIKKGAPKPDITRTEGFRQTLLAARSITYSAQGTSGGIMRNIFERFGIAEEMKAKTKIVSSITAPEAVAKGESELGFTQISEILPVEGAVLAGPLPPEVQVYTVFTAAVSASTKDQTAAQAFIKFLTAPAIAPVIKAKGMTQAKAHRYLPAYNAQLARKSLSPKAMQPFF